MNQQECYMNSLYQTRYWMRSPSTLSIAYSDGGGSGRSEGLPLVARIVVPEERLFVRHLHVQTFRLCATSAVTNMYAMMDVCFSVQTIILIKCIQMMATSITKQQFNAMCAKKPS